LYGKKSKPFKQSVEPETAELVTLTPEEQKLLDQVEEVGEASIKHDIRASTLSLIICFHR